MLTPSLTLSYWLVLWVIFAVCLTLISPGTYCPVLPLTMSCGVMWNILQRSGCIAFTHTTSARPMILPKRGKSGCFVVNLFTNPHWLFLSSSLSPRCWNIGCLFQKLSMYWSWNEDFMIHWSSSPVPLPPLNTCVTVFLFQFSRNSLIFYNHVKIITSILAVALADLGRTWG